MEKWSKLVADETTTTTTTKKMRLFSSPPSSSSSHLPRLFPSPNPSPNPAAISKPLPALSARFFPPPPLLRCPAAAASRNSSAPLRSGDVSVETSTAVEEDEEEADDSNLLVVRRPVKDGTEDEDATIGSLAESDGRRRRRRMRMWKREDGTADGSSPTTSSKIDRGLSEFAKSMPMFEPARVELEEGGGGGGGGGDASGGDRPLPINLELGLYRAKVLTRSFKFKEADEILRKCISFWPEDGRPYVALGKLLSKQSKFVDARSVYEMGCQATQGENSYIWQCWAVLENKVGNIKRARELFDAATVADKRHVAAWHGWAVLEIKQGNIKKARNLLAKGLRYCGANEYIYQTLALLEAKGQRIQRARYLFQQATKCNPKSCASWLAWAQVEMQQQNNYIARQLFEKAVQASPKNRFAWHIWALFEANQGNIDKGRKLFKIGHALNPKDPVILQSLALLEYRQSFPSLARAVFKKASAIDPRHQPVWIAWGWMEWKEGNINIARELYQRAISIDSTSESAARCLQAWGVLEQRVGNLSVARRLFRSSLNINSQSYITWMTWASLEEDQGNAVRAEEIRNLYYQQRTEVVDDASWVMGLSEIIDPALDGIKRLLNLDQGSNLQGEEIVKRLEEANDSTIEASSTSNLVDAVTKSEGGASSQIAEFDLDGFVREKLKLDVSNLDAMMASNEPKKFRTPQRPRRAGRQVVLLQP